MSPLKKFNLRIYGLLIENGKLLLADERIQGNPVTKFPGGGLELGEGARDCLAREFLEETGFRVEVTEHFYTTDFFQLSAFNPDDQIISIYYFVKRISDFNPAHCLPVNEKETLLSLRWVEVNTVNESTVTLPIDKIVVGLLLSKINSK